MKTFLNMISPISAFDSHLLALHSVQASPRFQNVLSVILSEVEGCYRKILFFIFTFFICHFSFSQFNIIPQPVEINYSKAHNVIIDSTFTIKYHSFDLADEADLLSDYFKKFHSLDIPAVLIFQDEDTLDNTDKNWILLDKSGNYQEKTQGSYELNVLPGTIQINGNDEGIFFALFAFFAVKN
jgi:hypothetical protein